MREIDLGNIQTYYIGLEQEQKRNNYQAALAQKIGLKAQFVSGVKCAPGYFGCSMGHLRALVNAKNKNELPVLLLENDCAATNQFNTKIQVPVDADIMYLGNSSCGCVPEYGYRGVRGCVLVSVIEESDSILRVDNMTATHAILYISSVAVDSAISSIIQSIAKPVPLDVGYVLDLQTTLNVYTFKLPFFYQASFLQSSELADVMQKMTLNEVPVAGRRIGESFSFIDEREEKITLSLQEDCNSKKYWSHSKAE